MQMLVLTLVPKAYALPLAAILMILVGLHISVCREVLPPSARRRIRISNGYVSLLAIPLLAVGFSVINPDTHPTMWALVWLLAMALVAMIIGLAVLDVVNTARLSKKSRAELRRSLKDAIAAAQARRADSRTDDTTHHEA